MNKLVSIIMPNYNSEKYISQTINSVLNQTYQNWELIIVDDKSTDNSPNIIKEFIKNDNRIKLTILETNSGRPALPRNIGIKKAQGDFIAFLDSDDLWYKDKLKLQLDFMIKNNYYFTYSAYDVIDENNKLISSFTPPMKLSYNDLLKTNSIGCLSAIYDVNYFGKVYMEDVGHEDYTLWLKLLKKVDFAYGMDKKLAQYRKITSSISSNKFKVLFWQWKIYRDIEKLSLLKSAYNFIFYVYNGLIKYR